MTNTTLKHAWRTVGVASIMLAAHGSVSIVWAGWPVTPTPEELPLMPPYCPQTQEGPGHTPEGYARWRAIYGEAFHHFHHYCYAAIYLIRADSHSAPPALRNHYLSNAFADIDYVVKRTPANHVLMPELLTKLGVIRRRQGQLEDAIALFNKAAAVEPKYWRAYVEVAISYLARNQKDQAREALLEGLLHAPNAKGLTTMLKELGGESGATQGAQESSPAKAGTRTLRIKGGRENEAQIER